LNEQFGLSVRPADRLQGFWQSSGDIVDRHIDKPIRRIYGIGRTRAAAEEEVEREAVRWLQSGTLTR
jgi:hypothetical protein